jgi:hypothetical protein
LERGPDFAAEASAGSIAGVLAQAGFCLAYAAAASRGWLAGLAAGTLAFVASALALQALALAPIVLFVLALASLALTLRLLPRGAPAVFASAAPLWEIPLRAGAVTTLVVGVTSLAALLGARASGAVACFPLIGAALAVFAHRAHGAPAGVAVLRGMAAALFSFAGFFLVVGLAIPRFGALAAFTLAIVVALVVQAATLRFARAG